MLEDWRIICNEVSRPQKDAGTPVWLSDKREHAGSDSHVTNSNEEPVLITAHS